MAAAIAGVTLTAGVLYLHSQVKLASAGQGHGAPRERRLRGDGRGSWQWDGRPAGAVDQLDRTALADTHDKATMDRLTGVANRQALLGELFAEVERAGRYERPLSVAFVDIDHFKAVNDSYGHAAGDVVLRGVAQTISANLRASDRIGRYGGEEFMLILTETDVDEGAVLTEKLRDARPAAALRRSTATRACRSRSRSGSPAGRDRACAWTRSSATRTPRCTRPSPSGATRPTSSPSPTTTPASRVPRSRPPDGAHAMAIGKQAREAATLALTSVLNPLPHYRGQPSALIASIVVALARQLELPDAEVDRIRIAALLHDVGKIAVPQDILEKPAALTSAEWRTVVQHPRIGQVILEQAASLKEAVPIILHHHERYGGHGYPYGLRGERDPARRADRRDRRRLRRDDPRPAVQARDVARERDRGVAPPRRHPVRPGARRAVLRPLRHARTGARSGRPRDDGRARAPTTPRRAGSSCPSGRPRRVRPRRSRSRRFAADRRRMPGAAAGSPSTSDLSPRRPSGAADHRPGPSRSRRPIRSVAPEHARVRPARDSATG